MTDLLEQKERGIQAKALLDHPMLKSVLDDMEHATVAKWRAAESEQARTELWHFQKAIGVFRRQLQVIANNGTIAEKQMEQIAKR